MIQKATLLIISILFSFTLYAQRIIISGTVKDQYGKPINGVTVAQANSSNGTFTNDAGKYSIRIPKSRPATITFSCIGYQQVNQAVNYSANTELNITMVQDTNVLDSVNIEGRKRQTNTFEQIGNIRSRTRFMPNASGGAVESLISTFGGVSATNELSSQYSVRGGNFDENIIYVNGMEIYRPLLVRSGQQEGLSFINPNMVQTVNFSTGGYSAEYGDKMSSVLDIIYKTPSRFEASAEASLLGGSAYIGSSTGRFSQMTSVRYKTNESLLSTTDTKAEYDPSFLDLQSYITFALSSNWQISFLGNVSNNIYKFTPQSRETKFGTLSNVRNFKVYFDGWEKDKFLTYHGAISLKGKIGDNLELGIMGAAFSSDEYERYDISGSYTLTENYSGNNNNNASEEEGLLGIGSYHEHARNKLDANIYTASHFGSIKIDKHLLKWGLTFQKEEVKDKIKEWVTRDSAGYILPDNGQAGNIYSNITSDNKANSTRLSGYLQDSYRFNTNIGLFVLNAGVRASYWSFNEEFLFSPRGSLAFIPEAADQLTLRFASGIYYQAPFYKEMQRIVRDANGNNIIELNKDIKSQKSIHFLLGGDVAFKAVDRPFKFSTDIYYKKLSDLIPYTVNNVKIRYTGENIAKGYTAGIDFKLYGEFVEGVDSWISLSLMKTQQDIDGIKTPLPTDQRYNVSVYFQDYMPGYERLRMVLTGSFSQGLPTNAPYRGLEEGYYRLPAYKRVDIGLSWQILGEDFDIRNRSSFCKAFKNIWLGADLFNVFDINNTNTFYWISDVYNNQYAIPNYLTGRQFNVKLIAEF
jgi:hypothetical protein